MLNSLKAIELLKKVALRPTKQRIALTKILFQENHLHVTAEQLHSEAIRKGYKISLATVYNALNRFKEAGIVKQVLVEPRVARLIAQQNPNIINQGGRTPLAPNTSCPCGALLISLG